MTPLIIISIKVFRKGKGGLRRLGVSLMFIGKQPSSILRLELSVPLPNPLRRAGSREERMEFGEIELRMHTIQEKIQVLFYCFKHSS